MSARLNPGAARRFVAVLCAAAGTCLVTCAKPPVDGGDGSYDIALSLEEKGREEATFWGEPIDLIVELPDSFAVKELALHIGSATRGRLSSGDDDRMKTMTVPVYWEEYPQLTDSLSGITYDTLFITVGGELYRSNTVRVYVRNLAPVIDSIVMQDTGFGGNDTLYSFSADSADYGRIVTIRVTARDADQQTLQADWSSISRPVRATSAGLSARYAISPREGIDTITVVITDRNGGREEKRIRIETPNRSPVIDSVDLNGRRQYYYGNVPYYTREAIDTLTFRIFAHDPDSGDSLAIEWSSRYPQRLHTDSARPAILGYSGCSRPECSDTVNQDTLYSIDTIRVAVHDAAGDSVTGIIRILRGSIYWNYYPTIDSIQVNATRFLDSGNYDTTYRYDAQSSDTLTVSVFCHDRDAGDTLDIVAWATRDDSRLLMQKYSNSLFIGQYYAETATYVDTLVFVVGDQHDAEDWTRVRVNVQ